MRGKPQSPNDPAAAAAGRSNLSYVVDALSADLRLSSAAYGLGAGLFFISYTSVELPSNLLLHAFGGRAWLSRILITWGLVASCGAAVKNTAGFYAWRLALGAAEAGFFPGAGPSPLPARCAADGQCGLLMSAACSSAACRAPRSVRGRPVISVSPRGRLNPAHAPRPADVYMGHFFHGPAFAHARAMLMAGAACSGIVGGWAALAVTTLLDGAAGLPAWRWLFLLEGFPAVMLGVLYPFILPATPRATTMSAGQSRAAQKASRRSGGTHCAAASQLDARPEEEEAAALRAVLSDWRVWWLGCAYGISSTGFYTILFWGPVLIRDIVGARDVTDVRVIALSMMPFAAAVAALAANTALLQSTASARRAAFHSAAPLAAAAVAFVAMGLLAAQGHTAPALLALVVANAGVWAQEGPFGMLREQSFPVGKRRAASFAIINGAGNLGGFAGGFLLGALRKQSGGDTLGCVVNAVLLGVAAAMSGAYGICLARQPVVVAAVEVSPPPSLHFISPAIHFTPLQQTTNCRTTISSGQQLSTGSITTHEDL